MRNRLLNLIKANAGRGSFRAEGNTLYVYDVIVSSKLEAEYFGGIDAESFVQTVRSMSGPIALRINSPGGDVFAARAMAQALRDHGDEVTAYVDGVAASAASFLTSAAGKVHIADGGMIMIHKSWTMAVGNADDLLSTAELLEKVDGGIADTYASASKRRGKCCDAAAFTEMMACETWLTAAEAVDCGLADAPDDVEAGTKPAKPTKCAIDWDFTAYKAAPAAAEATQADETPEPVIDTPADENASEAVETAPAETLEQRTRRLAVDLL